MRKNKILYRFISIIVFSIIIFSLLTVSTVMAEAGCLKVTKSWDGDKSLAPDVVIVDVYNAADDEISGIIYLTEAGNWENTICNLTPGERYYIIERPVSSFDSNYPAGNSVVITASNDQDNPAELEIENTYAHPNRTFKLSIYNVTVINDIYQVTVTICADQNSGFDEDIYFNDEKSSDNYIDFETTSLDYKGDCQQIVFEVNVADIDLNKTHYVGYPPQSWIAIGEPRVFIPISVNKFTDLNFGSFTAKAGTITIDPEGGLIMGGGYSGYHDGNQQPAAIEVNWLPYAQYSVGFSNQITISHDQNEMTVRDFTTGDNNAGTLDGFGYDIFNIGATIDVTEGLEPGLYSGQFFVTVSFE